MCGSLRRDFDQGLQGLGQAALDNPDWQKGAAIALDFINAVETGCPARMEPENVEFLNSLQVTNAERFLFSANDNFSLVTSIISAHPNLRVGSRIEEATGKF